VYGHLDQGRRFGVDSGAWVAVVGGGVAGWLLVALVGIAASRLRVRRRRGRVALWAYLVASGLAGTGGLAMTTASAAAQRLEVGNPAQGLLFFLLIALFWPYLVLYGLAVWRAGGHG